MFYKKSKTEVRKDVEFSIVSLRHQKRILELLRNNLFEFAKEFLKYANPDSPEESFENYISSELSLFLNNRAPESGYILGFHATGPDLFVHQYFQFTRNNSLICSCTDTLMSRKLIAQGSTGRLLWLDAGNELHHGQAVIGTTRNRKSLKEMYDTFEHKPYVLNTPNIAAVNPAVMRARRTSSKAGCAAQPFALQGFGVNAMAALAAATIAKIDNNK